MTAVTGSSRRRRSMIVSLVLMLVISFGSLFATLLAGWHPKLGLDLAGGTEVVLTPAKGRTLTAAQLSVTEQIIRNRVTGIGVSGATVQTQGNPPQIIVQVPGVNNGRTLDRELSTTAQLLLPTRPVLRGAVPGADDTQAHREGPPSGQGEGGQPARHPARARPRTRSRRRTRTSPSASSPTRWPGLRGVEHPAGPPVLQLPVDHRAVNKVSLVDITPDVAKLSVIEDGLPGSPAVGGVTNSRYVLLPAVMNGTAISGASAQQTQTGQWVVNCTLTSKGSAQWDYYSEKYFHQYIGRSTSTGSCSPRR